MFKASDGKEFAHEGMGKSYEGALQGGKGGLKPSSKPEQESPESVVAAHGPAHTTHIVKDKMSGKHSVHSEHEDGHKHSSHGHSVESAHEHSMTMHGHDAENPREDNTNELEATASENPETETSNMGS